MISQKMKRFVSGGSEIRAMFEEGKRLAEIWGKENVYDFSLGNPSVPAPDAVRDAIAALAQEDPIALHGYMSNGGYDDVRAAIAAHLTARYGTDYAVRHIVMSVGAAGGLNVALKSLLDEGDEVVVFAPYFGEYRFYADNFGGRLVEVPPNPPTFLPDPAAFERAVTEKTKAVIVNTPNNPTGVVYDEATIAAIAEILENKQKRYGKAIYLISDEPYRELTYIDREAPYIPRFYRNTIVCYSYSKSLSLPGERIGYLAVTPDADDCDELLDALGCATRILGFVNAPALQQKAIARCLDCRADVNAYRVNRDLLSAGLKECGFTFTEPQGAFYLWVKSPIADERVFCAAAKKYRLLLVAGSNFACPGYVRIAYCVSKKTIERSMPAFAALARECGLNGCRKA